MFENKIKYYTHTYKTGHENEDEFEDTVNGKRTDNIIAKRKRTKKDLQNIHIKRKI
jgi:hypothetical protein